MSDSPVPCDESGSESLYLPSVAPVAEIFSASTSEILFYANAQLLPA